MAGDGVFVTLWALSLPVVHIHIISLNKAKSFIWRGGGNTIDVSDPVLDPNTFCLDLCGAMSDINGILCSLLQNQRWVKRLGI